MRKARDLKMHHHTAGSDKAGRERSEDGECAHESEVDDLGDDAEDGQRAREILEQQKTDMQTKNQLKIESTTVAFRLVVQGAMEVSKVTMIRIRMHFPAITVYSSTNSAR